MWKKRGWIFKNYHYSLNTLSLCEIPKSVFFFFIGFLALWTMTNPLGKAELSNVPSLGFVFHTTEAPVSNFQKLHAWYLLDWASDKWTNPKQMIIAIIENRCLQNFNLFRDCHLRSVKSCFCQGISFQEVKESSILFPGKALGVESTRRL